MFEGLTTRMCASVHSFVFPPLFDVQMGAQQENELKTKVESGTHNVLAGPVKASVFDGNEFDRGGGMRLNIDTLLTEVCVWPCFRVSLQFMCSMLRKLAVAFLLYLQLLYSNWVLWNS